MDNLEGEIWKEVAMFPVYEISNLGRLRSVDRVITYKMQKSKGKISQYLLKGKLIKHSINKTGYLYFSLSINNRTRNFFAHRLMAIAFLENPENKPCIDHINTIRTDNRLSNLRWATHKENSNNETTIKSKKKKRGHYSTGNKILQISKEKGILLKSFRNASYAAEYLGRTRGHVHYICRNSDKLFHNSYWTSVKPKKI